MQKRGLSIFLTTTIIFIGLMLVQNYFFPAKPKPDAAIVENQDQPNQDKDAADKDAADKDAADKGNVDQEDADKNPEDNPPTDEDKKEDGESTTDSTTIVNDLSVDQLIPIGSLASDAQNRMLVAINRRGATIRRIELNERLANGKLKFRDVENKIGYLGHLELTESVAGCQINFVGTGTPADMATASGANTSLTAGDVIVGIDDELTPNIDAFHMAMENTKPGQTITLKVYDLESESNVDFSVDLINKPLEVVRPEPYLEFLDEKTQTPTPPPVESMLLTVVNPTGTVWNEIEGAAVFREGIWNVVDQETNPAQVVLSKKIPVDGGTLTVTKRFSLPEHDATLDGFQRDYHVNLEFDFLYEADSQDAAGTSIPIAFNLFGPTGTPVDGWWYQNKIHGDYSALFSVAGARDVVFDTKGKGFNFVGGPKIVANFGSDDAKNMNLYSPGDRSGIGMFRFMGVDTQYFSAVLLPDERYAQEDGRRFFDSYSAFVWMPSGYTNIPKVKRERRAVDLSFMMFSNAIDLKSGEHHTVGFELFAGPKNPKLLNKYDLSDLRSFGWFWFVSKPLCGLLRFFYWIFSSIGLPSYGLAIILLTIIVRSLMVPISRKAALNAQMMQRLAPEMKLIADKYKEDMEGRLKAQRELFSRNKYNPYGGCVLMFLQLPIFIGLYRGLSVDIALRDQPFIPGIQWCSNLAGPDQLFNWSSWMPAMLASETGWLGPYFNILPCITVVFFLIQQKLFTPPATDDQQIMMQKMMKFMMIFMGVLFFKVPAGLCLYFITSSLWGIAERKLLPKPVLKDASGIINSAPQKKKTVEGKVLAHRESDDDRKQREKEKRNREKLKRKKTQ